MSGVERLDPLGCEVSTGRGTAHADPGGPAASYQNPGSSQAGDTDFAEQTEHLGQLMQELRESNSKLAARTRELEEQAKQLALVSQYKSEFLANMSHELRTPLNSILILARLLADNEKRNLDRQQIEYANTIFSAGNDLLALISQILDLSKIEAGKMEIERQTVYVADVCDFVDRTFSQTGVQRRIAFSIEVESSAPLQAHTDPLRLQQILKNLLSNAFKFTERGSVTMSIARAAPQDVPPGLKDAAGVLVIRVRDSGIGIELAKQQLIFEAFHQADSSTSRNYGGTGLGLTISRQLAFLLGGSLTLDSIPGQGSTFSLFLPLRARDLRAESPVAALMSEETGCPGAIAPQRVPVSKDGFDFTGHTTMLVDDDIRNLFAVTCLLERTGMSTVTARSGKEALRVLSKHPEVELVLMDMMMPEMDGFDATRAIRVDKSAASLPVIAMTAKAMPGDREECLKAGCNDFIPKPVHVDVLLGTIAKFMPNGASGAL